MLFFSLMVVAISCAKKEKEELQAKIQKEQHESQNIRTSLNSLEEQLRNSSNLNTQKIQELSAKNIQLQNKINGLTANLNQEKTKVQNLTQESKNKEEEIKKIKDQLQASQEQLQNSPNYLNYLL